MSINEVKRMNDEERMGYLDRRIERRNAEIVDLEGDIYECKTERDGLLKLKAGENNFCVESPGIIGREPHITKRGTIYRCVEADDERLAKCKFYQPSTVKICVRSGNYFCRHGKDYFCHSSMAHAALEVAI